MKYEVASRLEQSLHNAVLINLGKELQPQQVKRPWDAEIKIGLKPPEPFPENTSIVDVFDSSAIAGKFLILGAPGSGKTTTLLELAQALVNRAEEKPDFPIVVLLNLSSWKDDKQLMRDWLVAELNSKYGVPKNIGKSWVDNQQLLPMLDGLDELALQHQEPCVRAINKLLTDENHPLYLVICSRIEEYQNLVEAYKTCLQLNGAVCLKVLTKNQICDYLNKVNYASLWQTINSDPNLLELVTTPLLLSVTILAFQEISINYWHQLTSTSDRLQYLLDAYVQRMFGRLINSKVYVKQKSPTARESRLWLVWLAQQLQKEFQTELIIEKMQPTSLLNVFHRRNFRIKTVGTIFAIIVLFFSMIGDVLSGLIFGVIIGLSFGLKEKIETVETLKINQWIKIKIPISKGITVGLEASKIFVTSFCVLSFLSVVELIIIARIDGNVKYFLEHFKLGLSLFKTLILISSFLLVNFIIISELLTEIKILETLETLVNLSVRTKFQPFHQFFQRIIQVFQRKIQTFQRIIQVFQRIPQGLHELIALALIILLLLLLLCFNISFASINVPDNSILSRSMVLIVLVIFVLVGLIWGLVLGLFWGLFFGLISWLTGSEIELKIMPNQGIWRTLVNAGIFGIVVGLIFVLIQIVFELFPFYIHKSPKLLHELINSLITGFIFGGIFGGGGACIQHFVLRLTLYRNGYIPWNYARFLDYCTERMLLQRVGGRYRFIHKLLQDHFAQMPLK